MTLCRVQQVHDVMLGSLLLPKFTLRVILGVC